MSTTSKKYFALYLYSDASMDQMKELMEQFETLQEELDRRREECIQLRTVLANVSLDYQDPSLTINKDKEMPEAEEVLAAYETQKVIIAQLQDQLNEERSRGVELEQELRDEIDSLSKTCSDQQVCIVSERVRNTCIIFSCCNF